MRNPQNDPTAVARSSVRPERSRGTKAGRVSTSLDANGDGERHVPERTCVLTRRKDSKQALIRLALGPDGQVAPDVRARAPGRGAWIGDGKGDLEAAVSKGKLKGALARAFKTGDLTIPADLAERTSQALRQATLDRLGMEARSGNLVNGAERVEAAARSGQVHLMIHAADASEDGRRRLDQAWRVGGGGETKASRGVIFPEGRSILSMALGRENVVHIALTDRAAAARVLHALARWRVFNDPGAGLDGGDPASGSGSADDVDEGTE